LSTLRLYLRICVEISRKVSENLRQDDGPLGRESDPGSPEYEAGVLITTS
jgi:hypothetical protein